MTKQITHTATFFFGPHSRRTQIHTLITLIGFAAALYIYFLVNITLNMLDLKQIGSESRDQGAEIGTLEVEYFGLSRAVTLDKAHKLGFIDAKEQFFAGAIVPSTLSIRQ